MNKNIKYLFIFILAMFYAKETLAGTDALNNALMVCNAWLKGAGKVQEEVSTKIRGILSLKISPEDLLRKVGAGKLVDAAEKLRERGELLKEKADKVKERMEYAKEDFEELKATYDELNQKANEKFAQAKAMLEEGKAIYEEYKGKYEQAKEMYNDVKGAVETGIEVGKDVVGTIKVNNENLKGVDQSSSVMTNTQDMIKSAEMTRAQADMQAFERGKGVSTMPATDMRDMISKEMQITPINQEKNASMSIVPQARTANAITSASKFAEGTSVQIGSEQDIPDISDLKNAKLDISAADILKDAGSRKKLDVADEKIQKTDVRIDAQLQNIANKTQKIEEKELNTAKLNKDNVKIEKENLRAKFGEKKIADTNKLEAKEVENKEILKARELAVKKAEKQLKPVTKKANFEKKQSKINEISTKMKVNTQISDKKAIGRATKNAEENINVR